MASGISDRRSGWKPMWIGQSTSTGANMGCSCQDKPNHGSGAIHEVLLLPVVRTARANPPDQRPAAVRSERTCPQSWRTKLEGTRSMPLSAPVPGHRLGASRTAPSATAPVAFPRYTEDDPVTRLTISGSITACFLFPQLLRPDWGHVRSLLTAGWRWFSGFALACAPTG